MTKKPNNKIEVKTTKEPKVFESPAKWKDHYISWQINRVDEYGEWGLNNLKTWQFKVSDSLINSLDGIHNDLFEAVYSLDNKSFPTIEVFLNTLSKRCHNNIEVNHQQLILGNLKAGHILDEIFAKLKHLESFKWNDIEKVTFGPHKKTSHHSVAVEKISAQAKKRLSELKLDDYPELFSLRLEGKVRIWGIRQFAYLQIIWFDLNHTVYPVGYN